jgi:hypothetical protein
MPEPARFARTQLFAAAADAERIAAVIAALTGIEPSAMRMPGRDGTETQRYGFDSAGIALEFSLAGWSTRS